MGSVGLVVRVGVFRLLRGTEEIEVSCDVKDLVRGEYVGLSFRLEFGRLYEESVGRACLFDNER